MATIFNIMSGHFVKFVQCFFTLKKKEAILWLMPNLGTNTIKHASQMELYMILPTLIF